MVKGLASRLPTESLKEQTKTCPRQQTFRATCPKGKLEFKFLSNPASELYISSVIVDLECAFVNYHGKNLRVNVVFTETLGYSLILCSRYIVDTCVCL